MGRKHPRAGKYVYLFLALFIAVSAAGCALFGETRQSNTARSEIRHAHALYDQGNYRAAIDSYMNVVAMLNATPPADEALFYAGLSYLHPDNRNGDFAKASEYLHRLMKEYPDSPYNRQSVILIPILSAAQDIRLDCLSTRAAIDVVKQRRDELRKPELLLRGKNYTAALKEYLRLMNELQKTPEGEEALFMAGVLLAHPDSAQKNYSRATDYFLRVIREYPEGTFAGQATAWIGTIKAIEALKSVDLEFKERKRHGR